MDRGTLPQSSAPAYGGRNALKCVSNWAANSFSCDILLGVNSHDLEGAGWGGRWRSCANSHGFHPHFPGPFVHEQNWFGIRTDRSNVRAGICGQEAKDQVLANVRDCLGAPVALPLTLVAQLRDSLSVITGGAFSLAPWVRSRQFA